MMMLMIKMMMKDMSKTHMMHGLKSLSYTTMMMTMTKMTTDTFVDHAVMVWTRSIGPLGHD